MAPRTFPAVRATGAKVGPVASAWNVWLSQPELAITRQKWVRGGAGTFGQAGLDTIRRYLLFLVQSVYSNSAGAVSLARGEGADVGFA